MQRLAIHYAFDPTAIHDLPGPGWVFHVKLRLPGLFVKTPAGEAAQSLRHVKLEAARLGWSGPRHRHFELEGRYLSLTLEVPAEVRQAPDGLARFEADFWRLMAAAYAAGFREGTFEAVGGAITAGEEPG